MTGLPERIRSLLWENKTLVMATERDGRPWISSVFYAPEADADGVQLVCALLASSRKLANLRLNPRAAIYVGPREPTCWLQGEGSARVLDDATLSADALARLTTHAPAAQVFIDQVPVVPIVLTLDSLRLTDLTGPKPPVETWETGR